MSDDYQLILTQSALESLERVPHSLADEVERALDRLAGSPTSVSVRAAFPHRQDRQLYHFSARDFSEKWWYFTVHFRFSQDERQLVVLRLTVREP